VSTLSKTVLLVLVLILIGHAPARAQDVAADTSGPAAVDPNAGGSAAGTDTSGNASAPSGMMSGLVPALLGAAGGGFIGYKFGGTMGAAIGAAVGGLGGYLVSSMFAGSSAAPAASDISSDPSLTVDGSTSVPAINGPTPQAPTSTDDVAAAGDLGAAKRAYDTALLAYQGALTTGDAASIATTRVTYDQANSAYLAAKGAALAGR